jgi:hypothetical protein
MFTRIWDAIKLFVTHHELHYWLENYLLYSFIFGLFVVIILLMILMIKLNKKRRIEQIEERKRGKEILKLLSDKKNKTY